MSGTIRSRTEAQRDRHISVTYNGIFVWCKHCRVMWGDHGCPDRVAADDTLTDLNNAELISEYAGGDATEKSHWRYIPDPDSRGAT